MEIGAYIFDLVFGLLSWFLDKFYNILMVTGLFGWFIAGITLFMGVRLVAQPLMGIRYGSDLGTSTRNVVNRFSSNSSNKSSRTSKGD